MIFYHCVMYIEEQPSSQMSQNRHYYNHVYNHYYNHMHSHSPSSAVQFLMCHIFHTECLFLFCIYFKIYIGRLTHHFTIHCSFPFQVIRRCYWLLWGEITLQYITGIYTTIDGAYHISFPDILHLYII